MTIELTKQEAQYLKSALEGLDSFFREMRTFKERTDGFLDIDAPQATNYEIITKVEDALFKEG